jgi:hypothetical protein
VVKATNLALHLTGIFVMSVGEPASNWNAQFVAGSSRDPITCVSMRVSICQNILALRLVVWVVVVAMEVEIPRLWTVYELWRDNFNFNVTLSETGIVDLVSSRLLGLSWVNLRALIYLALACAEWHKLVNLKALIYLALACTEWHKLMNLLQF